MRSEEEWLLDLWKDKARQWKEALRLYARAVLVDYERLDAAQSDAALIDAENYLKEAFFTDVRPAVRGWRRASGLPEDPLTALRKSGYLEEIAARRGGRNRQDRASYV